MKGRIRRFLVDLLCLASLLVAALAILLALTMIF
jgi:hypothetical protein